MCNIETLFHPGAVLIDVAVTCCMQHQLIFEAFNKSCSIRTETYTTLKHFRKTNKISRLNYCNIKIISVTSQNHVCNIPCCIIKSQNIKHPKKPSSNNETSRLSYCNIMNHCCTEKKSLQHATKVISLLGSSPESMAAGGASRRFDRRGLKGHADPPW